MAHLNRDKNLRLFLMNSLRLYRIDLGFPGDVNEIEYPIPLRWRQIKALGSCHDFLCISKADNSSVAMWNPFTGEHRLLPSLDTEIRDVSHTPACVHGFGHDDANSDLVLLRLVQTALEPIESAVSVYRWRDNAWSQLGEMQYYLANQHQRGVFMNGRLHWILTTEWVQNSPKVLVAFHIDTLEFVVVEDRFQFIDNKTLEMDLAILGGRLCLIIYGEEKGVEVWIMERYGSPESWHRLFSMPDRSRAKGLFRPLAYYQNEDQVLVEEHRGRQLGSASLSCYNLQTGDVEPFYRRGMPDSFEAEIC